MSTDVDLADTAFQEGMSHVRSRNFDSAVKAFRRAAQAYGGHAPTHNNLGSSLSALGRHEEAVDAFHRAVELDPNYAQAHFNAGASLRALGRQDEAMNRFLRAIELDPNHDEAFYYLGLEHQAAGRLNEALACYLRATDLNPNDPDFFTALASVLVRLRLPEAAVTPFERALSLNPDDSMARAHLMNLLASNCDWDRLQPHMPWAERLGVDGGPVPPFALLSFDDDPARHRIRSVRFCEGNFALIKPLPLPARPTARPERLRVAYLSADFHDHATMYLAAHMFELHDRERFSIHAYSYGPERSGAMRERVIATFDSFDDVRELSDARIADKVRADGIDIAVDLKGYTEFQRLGILSYRPAPIQMTYLGYPGTLGATFIDYLIADRVVVPDRHRHAYSEQLIYLPHSYQVNDSTRPLPDAGASRGAAGLPEEGFVFCCFNNAYKVSPAEFDIWMELLKQVEGSVLWLLDRPGSMADNLREQVRRRGVDADRLVIAPRTTLEDHIARLQLADLFLDTFNYNAHTTASDSLWAGVPVVTKSGEGFAARVAASLLGAVGMEELVTTNARDYAQLALDLARDRERLAALRARLLAGRTTVPLFDTARFTRHIEQAYDLAYARYLNGEQPTDIQISV